MICRLERKSHTRVNWQFRNHILLLHSDVFLSKIGVLAILAGISLLVIDCIPWLAVGLLSFAILLTLQPTFVRQRRCHCSTILLVKEKNKILADILFSLFCFLPISIGYLLGCIAIVVLVFPMLSYLVEMLAISLISIGIWFTVIKSPMLLRKFFFSTGIIRTSVLKNEHFENLDVDSLNALIDDSLVSGVLEQSDFISKYLLARVEKN